MPNLGHPSPDASNQGDDLTRLVVPPLKSVIYRNDNPSLGALPAAPPLSNWPPGQAIRLEQERLSFGWVQQALAGLGSDAT